MEIMLSRSVSKGMASGAGCRGRNACHMMYPRGPRAWDEETIRRTTRVHSSREDERFFDAIRILRRKLCLSVPRTQFEVN
jgi:hypothetical protein